MRRALYDPTRGYYTRRIAGVGRAGDFTTAPMLCAAFGQAVARWALAAMEETGCRSLIEIGPGEGALAASVLRHLPMFSRWRTRLHLVETSAPLAGLQRKRLGRRACWHDSPAEALAACHGRAVIFSNELVDAFPVRRFQKTTAGWREIAVHFGPDGHAVESLVEPVRPLPDSSSLAADHPVGQRVEVHESYRDWLSAWLPQWQAGRLLTIDYGATAGRLYQRRPQGTVRGYLLQQRLEGGAIYQNPGRQDLTADVNFTDLLSWSEAWTCDSRLVSLAEFCRGFALPDGIGEAFLALDQRCRGGIDG